MQKLHLLFPREMLLPASFGAVAFETFAPLLLLAPAHFASVPFAIFGLLFHQLHLCYSAATFVTCRLLPMPKRD